MGECPVWDGATQALWWVDVAAPALHRWTPGTGARACWPMPTAIGSFALAGEDRVLVALRTGFHWLRPSDGALTLIVDPEPDRPGNRLNDGRCDRRGRFWCGSMAVPPDPIGRAGQLHRLGPDLSVSTPIGGLVTSNGLAFAPDGRTLYLSDSYPSVATVWRFALDPDTGALGEQRLLATGAALGGRPDGAAIDTDGCYWTALADGWAIARVTPAGAIDRRIMLPVSNPSMPAFGGPDLTTLFVTTIRPAGRDLSDQPFAGHILAIDTGAQGLPEPRFASP